MRNFTDFFRSFFQTNYIKHSNSHELKANSGHYGGICFPILFKKARSKSPFNRIILWDQNAIHTVERSKTKCQKKD